MTTKIRIGACVEFVTQYPGHEGQTIQGNVTYVPGPNEVGFGTLDVCSSIGQHCLSPKHVIVIRTRATTVDVQVGTLVQRSYDNGTRWTEPKIVCEINFRGVSVKGVPYVGFTTDQGSGSWRFSSVNDEEFSRFVRVVEVVS